MTEQHSKKTSEESNSLLKPYKSVEEMLFVDTGIKDFLVYGGKALYGSVVSMFRIPTTIRKGYNHQTWPKKNFDKIKKEKNYKDNSIIEIGIGIGVVVGYIVNISYLTYSIDELSKGNNIPLAVFGTTNLISGIFELGRLSRTRLKRLEVKAQNSEINSNTLK